MEKETLLGQRDSEIEKIKEHNRRVVTDLERKVRLAESCRNDENRELKDLRMQLEQAINERDVLENQVAQLRVKNESLAEEVEQKHAELNDLIESEKFLTLELEDRERIINELEVRASNIDDVEKLKEEKFDLLERIEEREDVLKSLQDESIENKSVIDNLKSKLENKEREIAMMISQAEELDGLLNRADHDVHESREKVKLLEKEMEEFQKSSTSIAQLEEIQKERDRLVADVTRMDSIVKAMTVNSDQVDSQYKSRIAELESEIQSLQGSLNSSENRIEALTKERELLARKIEKFGAAKTTTVSPKKSTALVDAETKINALEMELSSMRRAIVDDDNSYDSSLTGMGPEDTSGPTPSPPLTDNVMKAENMFHDAVDLCSEGNFSEAVALLEQASAVLSRLSKPEISKNDAETLKILESDIYGQLGVAFQSLSQVPEAIEAYTTAVDVDPQAHACHANLAVLLHHQSRMKDAENHARIAIDLAPEIDEYQTLLSQIKSFVPLTNGGGSGKFRASTQW